MITIQESNRYTEIIQFFIENELEFTEDQKQFSDTVIKYWEALDGEKLVGACVLRMREGAYAAYDYAIHRTAKVLEQANMIEVVVDDKESLFQPGSNLDTGLYCGWYSLAKYVDAFLWQKGSVGYHCISRFTKGLIVHNYLIKSSVKIALLK